MSSSRVFSFADLLSLGVPVGWPEAVAIVQELVERVGRGELATVPPLHDLTLGADGAVVARAVSRSTEPPVKGLADLLHTLLRGTNPPLELQRLAEASRAEPPAHQSVGDFQQALAFFERPGRQTLLVGLFQRSAEASAAADMNREVERLRAQQRDADEPAKRIQPRAPRRRGLAPVALTGALALVAAGGVGLWLYWPAQPGAGASTTSPAKDRQGLVERTAGRIAEAVKSLVSRETVEAPTPEESSTDESTEPSKPPRRRAPATPSGTVPANAAMAPVLSPDTSAAASTEPLPVTRPVSLRVEPDVPDRPMVFDALSSDVAPPIIERPHLRNRAAGVDDPDAGVLELLVNEDGSVDKVKLISPRNRFEDRMIVAAAKAWRFTPAEKDGQPVPYRLLVPLTW